MSSLMRVGGVPLEFAADRVGTSLLALSRCMPPRGHPRRGRPPPPPPAVVVARRCIVVVHVGVRISCLGRLEQAEKSLLRSRIHICRDERRSWRRSTRVLWFGQRRGIARASCGRTGWPGGHGWQGPGSSVALLVTLAAL